LYSGSLEVIQPGRLRSRWSHVRGAPFCRTRRFLSLRCKGPVAVHDFRGFQAL